MSGLMDAPADVSSHIVWLMSVGRFAEAHGLLATLLPAERDRLLVACRNTASALLGTSPDVLVVDFHSAEDGTESWTEQRNGSHGQRQSRFMWAGRWSDSY